jgi:hypothetical protein
MEILDWARLPSQRSVNSGAGSIRVRQRKFRCLRCYPSYLASRYHRLPWQWSITLSAPAGCFEDWWEAWTGIETWSQCSITSVADLVAEPLLLYVFAKQPGTGEPHVHVLVGNVSRDLLDQELARGPGEPRHQKITPVTHAWGLIHYVLAQTRIARRRSGESYARYVNRVKTDHQRGHDALITTPFDSGNLDALHDLMRARDRVQKIRRSTPEASAWGREMAAARWKK